ncbi:MAG: hypothetical protein PHG81_09050 [Aliarcobacter sp.]|nr:hypothetical protein [Aliarcobacter sp.]
MKKLFLSLTLIIVLVLVSVYGILFTKYGNSVVSSYIEKKINTGQNDVKLKVNDFTLTLKYLNFDASINDNSKINISGDLSLFKKSVDLKYDIKINELSTLKNLTKQEFKGPLVTSGIFIGNEQEAIIQGVSDIAQSQTKYYFNLEDFEPKNINVQVKNAKIEDLLVLLNKPQYAKGDLTIHADIKNANLSKLDGMIIAKIIDGKINNDIINSEFNQGFQSAINFQSDINAILTPNKAEIKSNLNSSLGEISMNKTTIDLSTNNIKTDYKIDIKNLSKLEGIISKKLNGEFLTDGNLKAFDQTIQIEGSSDVLEGITKYNAEFINFKPSNVKLSVENARLEKLLQVINEPIYSTGNLNIDANIKNADLNRLDGTIISKIDDGSIVNEVANVVFKQTLEEKLNYNLEIDTNLVPNQAISKAYVETTMGNLTAQKAVYDFDGNSFISDYLLNMPALEKLKDITKMNLKGKLDINGEISNKDNNLSVIGNSNTLGGTFDFDLKNDKLKANLKNIDVQELSNMLDYSKIFDSKANFVLDYDLLVKKGNLTGKLLNGHFLENDFTLLINQLTKGDLTKEVYETFDIDSQIDNKVLTSNLIMKSQNTQITTKDSVLDLEQNLVDAKIDTTIKEKTFAVKVSGDTSNPKISLDAKDLLKEQINKQLEKKKDKIQEKLNKVLGKNANDAKTKQLIDDIKSMVK